MTRHRLLLGAGSLLVFIGLSSFDLRGSADQVVYFPQGPPTQQPPVRNRVPTPQVGRAVVRGRVIDGQTGAAVARVRVRLIGRARWQQASDAYRRPGRVYLHRSAAWRIHGDRR